MDNKNTTYMEQTFKVNLSKTAKKITAIYFVAIAICVCVLLLTTDPVNGSTGDKVTFWSLLSLTVGVTVYAVAMWPRSITVGDGRLTLSKGIGRLSLPLKDITAIERASGFGFDIRLFGSGGVLGYTGWFLNAKAGRYMSYVGEYSDAFLVRTAGRNYVTSSERPDELVAAVARLTGSHGAPATAVHGRDKQTHAAPGKTGANVEALAFSIHLGKTARYVTTAWLCIIAAFFATSYLLGAYSATSPLAVAIEAGLAAAIAAATALCYALAPRRIELSQESLTIKRRIGSKAIPVSDITAAEPYGGMGGDAKRLCSMGVFGFTGWMRGKTVGNYFAYAADCTDTMLITTRKRNYVIGCDNTGELLAAVRRHLESNRTH